MKNTSPKVLIFGIIFCNVFCSYGQTPPPNDNCANATLLSSGATCTSGYEANGTIQSGEVKPTCGAGGNNNNKSVWYKMVADSTSMYVQMYLTGILNGTAYNVARWAIEPYNTATCIPGLAQHFAVDVCANATTVGDSDNMMILNLNSLVVGNTYLLQVYYQPGNSTPTPQFCISVGKNYSRQYNTCTLPYGAACQFTYVPSLAQVKASCTSRKQIPYLEGSQSNTGSYTFTATDNTMAFEVATDNKCTVTSPAFPISWTLYNSACASLQSGSGSYGSTKIFTGLTVGNAYRFTYTITSDPDCYITSYYPYVYTLTMLPIQLTSFNAAAENTTVVLNWSTESELNNDYFSIQHSINGSDFDEVEHVAGAGTSIHLNNYRYTHNSAAAGTNYYRLVQHDLDGAVHYSDVITAKVNAPLTSVSLTPNPVINNGTVLNVNSDADRQVTIAICDAIGRITRTEIKTVHAGKNVFDMDFSDIPLGIYNLILLSSDGNRAVTFVK